MTEQILVASPQYASTQWCASADAPSMEMAYLPLNSLAVTSVDYTNTHTFITAATLHAGYMSSRGVAAITGSNTSNDVVDGSEAAGLRSIVAENDIAADTTNTEVRAGFSIFSVEGTSTSTAKTTTKYTTGSQDKLVTPETADGVWSGSGLIARLGGGSTAINASDQAENASYYHAIVYRGTESVTVDEATTVPALIADIWRCTGASPNPVLVARHEIAGAQGNLRLSNFHLSFKTRNNTSGNVEMTLKAGPYFIDGEFSEEVTFFDTAALGGGTTAGTDAAISSGIVTDSASAKLATAGGFGFTMGRDRIANFTDDATGRTGSAHVSDGISFLEVIQHTDAVDDASTGSSPSSPGGGEALASSTVKFRDEFRRVASDGGIRSVSDGFGTSGVSLMSMWIRGKESISTGTGVSSGIDDHITNHVSGVQEYAAFDVNMNTEHRDFVYLRPTDVQTAHNRKVEFNLGSAPSFTNSTSIQYGVMARGSVGRYGQMLKSAAAWVRIDIDGSGTKTEHIEAGWIYHNSATGAATFSKRATKDVTSTFDPWDGWQALQLEVYLNPTSPKSDGPALFKVSLDGSGVTGWTLSNGAFVHTADGSGDIFADNNPGVPGKAKVFRGDAEGIFVAQTGTGDFFASDKLLVRKFDSVALTSGYDLQLGPSDQDSVSVQTTKDGVLKIDDYASAIEEMPYRVEYDQTILSLRFESGHTYSTPMTSKERRRWVFSSVPVNETTKDALVDMWEATQGPTFPFNFTPKEFGADWNYTATDPGMASALTYGQASAKARFTEDSLKVSQIDAGTYLVDFSLEEVF